MWFPATISSYSSKYCAVGMWFSATVLSKLLSYIRYLSYSENPSHADYDAGGYSPRLLTPAELEPDTIVYEEQDDANRLAFARKNLLKTGQAKVRELKLIQFIRVHKVAVNIS
jgi:hypothetical protein